MKLDLDITELKERLFGVTKIDEQWAIIFSMYMEDYDRKHPNGTLINSDEKIKEFMDTVSERLVANGTIKKDAKTGQFLLPHLDIFQ